MITIMPIDESIIKHSDKFGHLQSSHFEEIDSQTFKPKITTKIQNVKFICLLYAIFIFRIKRLLVLAIFDRDTACHSMKIKI